MTIWKFPFPVKDLIAIQMPKGARVLSVAVQQGEPALWALVNPLAPTEIRHFVVYGTGHPIPDEVAERYGFVGTFQMLGSLVFHVFARPPLNVAAVGGVR